MTNISILSIVRSVLQETASLSSKPFTGKVEDTYYFINVKGINNNYPTLPFGRQIDDMRKVADFKKNAKSTYISIKRTPLNKAFKEFKDLYKPTEYFGQVKMTPSYKDDSFKVWFLS